MQYRPYIAGVLAGFASLAFGALPTIANAGIFDGVSYGARYYVSDAGTCPAYEYPYYSCPSGIGGLFGAQPGYSGGVYGGSYSLSYRVGYGYAPAYEPYYAYYPSPQYQYYPPQQTYFNPQPQYYGGYDYYDYGNYGPQQYYVSSIGSPVIYF